MCVSVKQAFCAVFTHPSLDNSRPSSVRQIAQLYCVSSIPRYYERCTKWVDSGSCTSYINNIDLSVQTCNHHADDAVVYAISPTVGPALSEIHYAYIVLETLT